MMAANRSSATMKRKQVSPTKSWSAFHHHSAILHGGFVVVKLPTLEKGSGFEEAFANFRQVPSG